MPLLFLRLIAQGQPKKGHDMTDKEIDPNAAIDFMIAHSKKYAIADANKVSMEELRKTIKAEQMKVAEIHFEKNK